MVDNDIYNSKTWITSPPKNNHVEIVLLIEMS